MCIRDRSGCARIGGGKRGEGNGQAETAYIGGVLAGQAVKEGAVIGGAQADVVLPRGPVVERIKGCLVEIPPDDTGYEFHEESSPSGGVLDPDPFAGLDPGDDQVAADALYSGQRIELLQHKVLDRKSVV